MTSLTNEINKKYMSKAATAISKVSNDITIITKDNEEIHTNKYLLSAFFSILGPLVSLPPNDGGSP